MSKLTVFDRFCQEYDQWFDAHPNAFQSELEAVRRFIPSTAVGIEVGVGTGRFSAPFGITTGVEPSEPMAAIARSRGIEVIQAQAEKLPFADGTFDFVLFVNVICFLSDPIDRKAGFGDIQACQTIFVDPAMMTAPDSIREGHGQGGFVVSRGLKGYKETRHGKFSLGRNSNG